MPNRLKLKSAGSQRISLAWHFVKSWSLQSYACLRGFVGESAEAVTCA